MDATRSRRTRDAARRRWYANWRTRRFARFLGSRLAGTSPEKPAAPDQFDRSGLLAR